MAISIHDSSQGTDMITGELIKCRSEAIIDVMEHGVEHRKGIKLVDEISLVMILYT